MKPRRWLISALAGGALLVGLLIANPSAAMADVIADPNVFVCEGCSSPPSSPTLLTNTNSITVGVAGSFTLQNPLLIIVGVFNGNGIPSISYSGCAIPSACPAAPLATYGLTKDTAPFTSSSVGNAYAQLGLSAGGSESFVNWAGLDASDGFGTPTSFTLYAFALNTNLTSGSPITIDESGAANGSYLIAYSCRKGTGSSTGCTTNGDIGQTPFTTSGIVDTPPSAAEPSAITLLGLVLLGFAGLGLGKQISLPG